MIKMVVSDMDGTLLNRQSEISEKNIQAIRRLKEQRIEFAIASGRDYSGVYSILDRYGIRCEAILGNGSQYVDEDGRILSSCYMDKAAFLEVISLFSSEQIYYMIFTTGGFYTGCDPDDARAAFVLRSCSRFGRDPKEFEPGGRCWSMPCNHLQKADDFQAFIRQDLEIIKVEAFSLTVDKADRTKEKLSHIPGISYLSSFSDNIEVTDQHAQKGFILENVAHIKGLARSEIMVVGDGMNDLSLFECFPDYACAPSNAEEEIRRRAYRIVADHDQDGFAEAAQLALSIR